jgi:3,5-epimerase/4-reductase
MKKWILFGHKGWLGNYFSNLIEQTMKEVELIKPIERIHDHTNVSKLIDEVKPDRVISFAGRTSGGKYMTIDYLESEDKHAENVQDNLIGPLLLATLCSTRNIHFTYLGTGCIFTYDDQHTIANEIGFTESDAPNFKASKYSLVKGYTDQIMQLFDTRALNVRIRMPILPDEHPRNLITKLITYDKICSIPNSISVLSSLFPILVQMIERRNTGTINLVNPGFVSHNEILDAYTQIIDPNFRYNNFTPEEQAKVIKAARSNNLLDTRKLTDQCPLVLSGIEAVRKCFHTLKYVKLEKMSKSGLERFNEFITKMTQRSCWLPWVAPEVSKYAAVIIEPRKHAALEFIINSTMYFLRDQFSLYIMHGTENEEFVKQLVQKNKWKNVQLKSCHSANLTAYEYNNLLMSKNFWDTFPAAAEKVLIFQTDVLIRKFGIEKFLEYDYIGAVWDYHYETFQNRGILLKSIHRWKEMKMCIFQRECETSKLIYHLLILQKNLRSNNYGTRMLGEVMLFTIIIRLQKFIPFSILFPTQNMKPIEFGLIWKNLSLLTILIIHKLYFKHLKNIMRKLKVCMLNRIHVHRYTYFYGIA